MNRLHGPEHFQQLRNAITIFVIPIRIGPVSNVMRRWLETLKLIRLIIIPAIYIIVISLMNYTVTVYSQSLTAMIGQKLFIIKALNLAIKYRLARLQPI